MAVIRSLLLALAGALALAGCGEPDRVWPDPSPALWEVSGPDGAQGWLFGTIHSLPRGARWRTPAIDEAFAGSSLLVVEIANLGDSVAASGTFQRYATTAGLPPLTRRVPEARRPAVERFLDEAGLDDDAFPETETWGAALILANRVSRSDTAMGVDRALMASAPRVVGLETFAEQYRMFDRLPAGEQNDLLLGLAAEAAGETEDRRLTAWLTGDVAALERETATGILADPELREALQLSRNRAWAERIAEYLAAGERPFVAVGAGHMLGEEGLPALLVERGFTVR